jgi:hypothetical protein
MRLNTPEAIAVRNTPEAKLKNTERGLKSWATRKGKICGKLSPENP